MRDAARHSFPMGGHVVTVRIASWRDMLLRAAVFVVIITFVPLAAAAADGGIQKKAPTTIKVSMERMVARDIAGAPRSSTVARRARQGQGAATSSGFFKTGPGMVAIVVMAAGTGYALYSATHDRIHSAGKK
jgi:hypothetical protein